MRSQLVQAIPAGRSHINEIVARAQHGIDLGAQGRDISLLQASRRSTPGQVGQYDVIEQPLRMRKEALPGVQAAAGVIVGEDVAVAYLSLRGAVAGSAATWRDNSFCCSGASVLDTMILAQLNATSLAASSPNDLATALSISWPTTSRPMVVLLDAPSKSIG